MNIECIINQYYRVKFDSLMLACCMRSHYKLCLKTYSFEFNKNVIQSSIKNSEGLLKNAFVKGDRIKLVLKFINLGLLDKPSRLVRTSVIQSLTIVKFQPAYYFVENHDHFIILFEK